MTQPTEPLRNILGEVKMEIALLVTQSLQDKQIADRRGCSIRTVRNHLHEIYQKLNISGEKDSRVLLAIRVFQEYPKLRTFPRLPWNY